MMHQPVIPPGSPTRISFQSPITNVDQSLGWDPPYDVGSNIPPSLKTAVKCGGELVGAYEKLRPIGGLSEVSRRGIEAKAAARKEERRRALAEAAAARPRLEEIAAERERKKREIVARVVAEREASSEELVELRRRAEEMRGPTEQQPEAEASPRTPYERSAINIQAMWRCHRLKIRHKKRLSVAIKECSCVSLLGGPGTGKGTIGKRLCANVNQEEGPVRVVHISTGELIAKAMKRWQK